MIPATMKAVEKGMDNKTLHLVERPVPTPGPNQVLVKMACAPINPSDVGFLQTPVPAGTDLMMGREGSGTVVAAGSGFMARYLKGRRVACAVPYGRGGTWGEYALARASACVPLRKDVALEMGAMLLVNPITACALIDIIRRGGHRAFANTAAASQLGQMLIRRAAASGLVLVNIVRRQEQVDLLKGLGAEHILNSADSDFEEQLGATFARLGVTVALDAIGGDLTRQLLAALPRRGEVIVYGMLSRDPSCLDSTQFVLPDKKISGYFLGNWLSSQGLLKMLRLTNQAQKQLNGDLRTEIHRRVRLEEVPAALEDYRAHMTGGKSLIVME